MIQIVYFGPSLKFKNYVSLNTTIIIVIVASIWDTINILTRFFFVSKI